LAATELLHVIHITYNFHLYTVVTLPNFSNV